VLERASIPVGRADLFGASAGGIRVDDPACDLALAAALASAATEHPPPEASAFVGEVGLTGVVRGVAAMPARVSVARAAGIRTIFAAPGTEGIDGVRIVPVHHAKDALTWAGASRRQAEGAEGARSTAIDGPTNGHPKTGQKAL
jgi:DNA repair protein RadA/Sms